MAVHSGRYAIFGVKKGFIMKKILAAAIPLALIAGTAHAATKEIGTLDCNVSGGVGFIVGSTKALNCRFEPMVAGLEAQDYEGRVNRIGLDVGITGPSNVKFKVVTDESVMPSIDAITGSYSGIGASASAGVGLGADALVADDNPMIGLQPLAVSGQTGVNLAAGIQSFSLMPMGQGSVSATSDAQMDNSADVEVRAGSEADMGANTELGVDAEVERNKQLEGNK